MLKAHSLLYSVYVCLIVAIICGALLYFATLYNQLNLFYNTNENLYIQNQSSVNYALGNDFSDEELVQTDTNDVQTHIKTKSYGLLQLLIVKSYAHADTISSAHFVGQNDPDKTCIYLSNISKPISYSGKVKLIGDKTIPSRTINQSYVNNSLNSLTSTGTIVLSEGLLPEINSNFKKIAEASFTSLQNLHSVVRNNDSIYFNSFLNKTIEIELRSPILDNIVIKGNFILYNKDSIQVRKSAILEDVILKAPKITFLEGFKGNVQAFSTEKLVLGKSVELGYPSVLCLYNSSDKKSGISVGDKSKVFGAIVLFGNKITAIDNNSITLNKDSFTLGTVYCTGKIMLQGKVYGSVYTNRIFHITKSGLYENCIMDAEIDVSKKPTYFISIPLLENKSKSNGIYKKVL